MSAPRADRRRRAGASAARDLRRRAGLGALLPDRVRAGAVARAVGGGRAARRRRGRLPGDRLAAAGEGLPRVGRGHHARTRRPTRAGWGSASSSTRRAVHRPRGARRAREDGPRDGCCCLRPRRPALGRARQRAGAQSAARSPAGSRAAATATPSERSIAYAYLRRRTPSRARRSRSRSSAAGSEGEVAARAAVRPQGRADPGVDLAPAA